MMPNNLTSADGKRLSYSAKVAANVSAILGVLDTISM